jgi:hypothetical protein
VDREHEPERLHQLLQENDIVAITDVMGKGGVGKTELAKQYAWRYLEDYSGGCCWLHAQGDIDIGTQVVEFAIVKFSNLNFSIPTGLSSLAGRVAYCWQNWQPGKVLLIFDNLTDVQQIQPYLPPMSSRFKILITTRGSSGLPFAQLPLGGLPLDAALELLGTLLGKEQVKREPGSAKILCSHVGYIPLGIYQIAAIRRES